jgi:hypothetical protein
MRKPRLNQNRSRGAGRCCRTRAGLPKAVAPAGTSRVTTLPVPTSASSPMETPGKMIAPPPIQTVRPMLVRCAPHQAIGSLVSPDVCFGAGCPPEDLIWRRLSSPCYGGTEGSNPSPSSGESANFRSLSGARYPCFGRRGRGRRPSSLLPPPKKPTMPLDSPRSGECLQKSAGAQRR